MYLGALWYNYNNKEVFTNMKIKQTTLRFNTKHLQELTQCTLMPLWQTLTYTTENLKNLNIFLGSNQCIDWFGWNHITVILATTFHKSVGGSKSVCLVCIRPTDNFQSHPRTSFSINEVWSNKYDTHKSRINKRMI